MPIVTLVTALPLQFNGEQNWVGRAYIKLC